MWPEANKNIQTAIADMYEDVMTILGEKRENWPAKLRTIVSTQVSALVSLSPPLFLRLCVSVFVVSLSLSMPWPVPVPLPLLLPLPLRLWGL